MGLGSTTTSLTPAVREREIRLLAVVAQLTDFEHAATGEVIEGRLLGGRDAH